MQNQSQRTGFESGSEQVITFDEVMTDRLRAKFTRGAQDTSVKKDCMVLTEVEIYAYPLDRGFDTASLTGITLDGAALEGFDPAKKYYTVTLPYGAQMPELQAAAADHGTVRILPAISNDSAALVQVVSENGRNMETYTVQFLETPPTVVSAKLRLEQDVVTEDDITPVHVDAILESGEQADEDDLTVVYRVLNAGIPTKAEVRNGMLYAYWPGEVQLEAEVSLENGKKVVSEPLSVTIVAAQEEKHVVSYAAVTVDTKRGEKPVLPAVIRASYDRGLPKDVAVTWETVSAKKYGKYGAFTVNGSVDGEELKPSVTVRVRDILAAGNISLATPVGVFPVLPEQTKVYYTDGEAVVSKVDWEEADPKLLKEEGTFVVKGVTELGGYEMTASVRVTGDTVQSENHAKNRNGCPYSMAIASFSEGGSAVALNNGLLDKRTDWSNPNAEGKVWFGVIFGADYPETRYVDTIVLDLLEDSEWNRTKIESCKVEYYNKPIDLKDVPKNVANFDAASMEDHPFNNPDNWTTVTNLKQPETYGYGENTLTFDMVEVPAIRVTVNHGTPGGTYYMALKEFYAYGKQAVAKDSFHVSQITVDGESLQDFSQDTDHYSVELNSGILPELTLAADSNAAVTIVPAADINSEARLIVTSEDGLKTQEYTLAFTVQNQDLVKRLEEIEAEIGGLKDASGQIADLRAGIAALQEETKKIADLEESAKKVAELEEQIADLQEAAAALEGIQGEVSKIAAMQESIERLQEEVKKLEDVDQLKETLAKVGDLDDRMSNLKEAVDQLSGLEGALSRLGRLETDLAALQKEVEGLGALKGEIGKIRDLQEDIAGLKQETSQLDKMQEEIEKISGLQEEINALKKQAEKIEELKEAVAKIGALEQEMEKMRGQAERVEALEAEIRRLESERMAQAEAEIKKLQEEKTRALEAIRKIQEELLKLQAEKGVGLKSGDTVTAGGVKYRVTDVRKRQAQAYGVDKKNMRTITIAATVTVKGVSVKVTSIAPNACKGMQKLTKATIGKNVSSIGKRAFYGNKQLKEITVKGTKLKKAGASAFADIHKDAKIKVPKSKLSDYKKLLKGKTKAVITK